MKKDIGRRPQALQGLAAALDIIDPADFSDQGDMTNSLKSKRENRELCWRSRSPVKPVGFGSESFELVVLPCGNAPRLLKFMWQLDGILHDADSYGDILRTAHTWGCGTVVTIQMQPTKFTNLMLKMAIMLEVKKVAEEPWATGISPSPSKRVQVFMNETGMARQELITLLN